MVDISSDLPVIVEIVDSEEYIHRYLLEVDKMLTRGLVTIDDVEIIKYSNFEGDRLKRIQKPKDTAAGHFAQAKAVVNWQWLINLPSFYGFAVYDAYVKTVEINKIFDQEQAQFLCNNYQSPSFRFPSQKEESICM